MNELTKKSCIIYDFDGVIANTDQCRFDHLGKILDSYNINLQSNFNKTDIAGISTKNFLKKNFSNLQEPDVDQIIKQRRKIYLDNLKECCEPYELSIETIENLFHRNYQLYLATTNEKDVLRVLLEHLDIGKFFTRIFSREELEIPGSDLKNYSYVLSSIGKDPESCIVIEDSLVGVTSAKNAGICCIAFGQPLSLADFYAENYQKLRQLLRIDRDNGLTNSSS